MSPSHPFRDRGDTAEHDPPTGTPTRVPRSLHEAAHKLGYWPVAPVAAKDTGPSEAVRSAGSDDRDVVAHASKAVLAFGALGIVYGDLGTSPLYTVQTIFTPDRYHAVHMNLAGVYGIASLIFWALMIEVSIKYAGFIMRAHNRGDGGIMALVALVTRRRVPHMAVLVVLGIFGAGLFFGDGMITPAISVVSAVEGLDVVTPSLSHLVVPIALVILIGLFMAQHFGTGAVGWLFGPVILVWFVVIALLGAHEVALHPGVLTALSPTYGARFMLDHGLDAFLTLGGVVLCVTGAEALYADRGHFGAGPIRFTWFAIVLPAVLLNYLGQAALVLAHPSKVSNPFYLLAPHSMQIPLVVLATLATIIASQAAITGSFSVAKQALQLGLLPRIKIVNTSNIEGQIYVPIINWFLCTGVAALVLIFQNSNKLTDIYGVAVTGTFILNTILFTALARAMWKTPWWRLGPLVVVFLIVEIAFFAANLTKIDHGAWLSLAVGLAFAFIMLTWRQGRRIVTTNRLEEEGSLDEFLAGLPAVEPPLDRVPGTAIYLAPTVATTPLALRAEVEHNHVLHETVLIATIEPVSISHVELLDRCSFAWLGSGRFKVGHITLHVGYRDHIDLPRDLALARKRGLLARNLDLEHASYFVSRMQIVRTRAPGMPPWRKAIFVFMVRNASSPVEDFALPEERTVLMGQQIRL
ncbi:MAG: KUP/HAK/KT family potassium transporter [Solirubrobacteraceae bacterium]